MKLPLSLSAALLALSACGPGVKNINRYVEGSPHRRIAVMPFTPAPGRPNSGQQAADLLSAELQRFGFTLVDRTDLRKVLEEQKLSLTGAVKTEDAARLGQLLGVTAVLTGTVAEASEERVRRPPVYVMGSTNVWDGKAKTYRQVPVKNQLRGEEHVKAVVYSVTARLTDVETGALLWVASGSDHGEDEALQDIAADVLKELALGLGEKFLEKKL